MERGRLVFRNLSVAEDIASEIKINFLGVFMNNLVFILIFYAHASNSFGDTSIVRLQLTWKKELLTEYSHQQVLKRALSTLC